jgi:hypothetical protein
VLRTIEDILGTEHINLNTYYTRQMADVFDISSSGDWTFNAVASTLLKQTTLLAQGDSTVQYTEGPDLKPTHNAKYWTAKTRGFDFAGEDRVPPTSTTRFSGKVLREQRHLFRTAASGRSPPRGRAEAPTRTTMIEMISKSRQVSHGK